MSLLTESTICVTALIVCYTCGRIVAYINAKVGAA